MSTNDDILALGTIGQSGGGQVMGLIYQQLKIIALVLKEGFGMTDEDFTLLGQSTPTLNPAITPNPNFTTPI